MKLVVMIISFLLNLIRYAAILIFDKQYEMLFDYQWTRFKMDYSKSYDSFEDELHHYEIFQNTLKEIDVHNRIYEAGIIKWTEGINEFSDLSDIEFKESALIDIKYLGNPKVESRIRRDHSHVMNGNAPDSIDWREFDAVTPVRKQGKCGCCWAIVAASAVESHYAIKNNKLMQLSVQELIDCDQSKFNRGCSGGLAHKAFDYVVNNGLGTEEAYPYEAKQGACRKSKPITKILSGYTFVPIGEEIMKDAIGTVGPVATSLEMNPLKKYTGGIFECPRRNERKNDHAVLVIGYGEEEGVPFWLLKNSWGEMWGEDGYFRIQRGDGTPECGIYNLPHYPNVEVNGRKEEDNEE